MTYRMKQLSLSGIKIVVILTKQSGTRLLCFFAFLAVFTEAVPIAMQNWFFFLMQFYMRLCDDSHVLVNNCWRLLLCVPWIYDLYTWSYSRFEKGLWSPGSHIFMLRWVTLKQQRNKYVLLVIVLCRSCCFELWTLYWFPLMCSDSWIFTFGAVGLL